MAEQQNAGQSTRGRAEGLRPETRELFETMMRAPANSDWGAGLAEARPLSHEELHKLAQSTSIERPVGAGEPSPAPTSSPGSGH
jgi:hypothetical protein